jgi:hypothetical protein
MKPNFIPDIELHDFSITEGNGHVIAGGSEEDYVTAVHLVLPITLPPIPTGGFQTTLDGRPVAVHFRLLEDAKSDLLSIASSNLHFAAPGTGLESLPVSAFLDNRGVYPCVEAVVVFPWRIAKWIDASDAEGVKVVDDFEENQILGLPPVNEKVMACFMSPLPMISLG